MNEKLDPNKREFINKFLFIDGQYFLTKNWSFLKHREILSLKNLLELTLKSINKIQSKVMADNIILLWDSWPYKKTKELIEAGVDYKGDREFALDRINEIKELLLTEKDPQKVIQLKKELEKKEKDHAFFLVRRDAKLVLKEWLPQIGIGSLSITALEADDLACMASSWSSKNIDLSKNERSVICSSDSDWLSFCSPTTDMYRTTKEEVWLNYDNAPNQIPLKYRKFGVNLYEYNLLHNAYYGDHNNLKKDKYTVENFSFSSVLSLYSQGRMDEISHISKVFNALNVLKYYDLTIEEKFNDVCLNLTPNYGAYVDFCAKYELSLTPYLYEDLMYYPEKSKKHKNNKHNDTWRKKQ